MDQVTWQGVLEAAEAIAPYLPRTPSWAYPLLDEYAGTQVIVKHENVQPIGAFKVRGGVNLVLGLTEAEKDAGLITASTGNHAQSVAYAARLVGARAVVVVPTTSPAEKLDAVRALGAEVIEHGPTMTEAVELAQRLAVDKEMTFVDPGNTLAIVHGHATVTLELLQDHPDLEAIYVPVGSGTGAAGACVVRDELAPKCRIVGVQSSAAPAAWTSWKERRLVDAPCTTRMSGLATARGFALTQQVLWDRLDDFLLVDDDAISAAATVLATKAHTLAEGAGAAALAGLLADPSRPSHCAVILSGGNASASEVAAL